MEPDNRFQVRARAGELERECTAHAKADRRDAIAIGLGLGEEHVEPGEPDVAEPFDVACERAESAHDVVQVENVLRPDEPRPSWPRERMLAEAPDASDAAFRVPSPGAG